MEHVKLNLGAGDLPLPDCLNIDRKTGGEVFPIQSRGANGTPQTFADASADEVRASHVLEHFSHRDTLNVLKEWVRVLKPGGVLKIAVPNFDWIIDAYQGENVDEFPIEAYIMGGHFDENDRHGALFNRRKLTRL